MSKIIFSALFSLIYTKIFIYSPEELKSEIENRYSNHGVKFKQAGLTNLPIGSIMNGKVIYYPYINGTCSFNYSLISNYDIEASNAYFLLVDSSECSIAVQARNAHSAGAAALIISDESIEQSDYAVSIENESKINKEIPIYIISGDDGNLIKKYTNDSSYEVILSLTFEKIEPIVNRKINYTIWMSSGDLQFSRFIYEFYDTAIKLSEKQASFVPHYAHFSCYKCKYRGYQEPHPDCLSGGRYCARDPDFSGPFTGRDVVTEDLRQICIFRLYKDYKLWYRYMKKRYEMCPNDFSDKCSDALMSAVNLNRKNITKCMEDSFDKNRPMIDDNFLLSKEKLEWGKLDLIYFPALIVNNITYRGDWDILGIKNALCEGFNEESKPDLCLIPEKEISEKYVIEGWMALAITVIVISIIIFFLIVYRLWVRREAKSQVNYHISSYFMIKNDH
ncbi:unnamed protein product [Blepharisma stoltei]|uniref:PA domain-containing protein n=1 Tax=Blepharisma stoltei TaxID=1481888 RepID=A0AAU9K6F5_9CILI|nr:unnamed protein product [Blepharisma stoltei]